LRNELAEIMKQKLDAKTIVFAVKMFSYWARNIFKKIHFFPKNINIPIDSRLIALFEEYKWNYGSIFDFYFDLSKKLNIPQLHLDAIVWVNYDNLINNK
jgi:DNA-(apurinic or apyrimidinic site) lyase